MLQYTFNFEPICNGHHWSTADPTSVPTVPKQIHSQKPGNTKKAFSMYAGSLHDAPLPLALCLEEHLGAGRPQPHPCRHTKQLCGELEADPARAGCLWGKGRENICNPEWIDLSNANKLLHSTFSSAFLLSGAHNPNSSELWPFMWCPPFRMPSFRLQWHTVFNKMLQRWSRDIFVYHHLLQQLTLLTELRPKFSQWQCTVWRISAQIKAWYIYKHPSSFQFTAWGNTDCRCIFRY